MLGDWINKVVKPLANQDDFIKLVRANDNGEKWASQKINKMFQEGVPDLIPRIARARVQIYKNAAYKGDLRAQYYYGLSLQGIDNEESLRFLLPLAENGNVDAIIAIAMGYGHYGGYGEDEAKNFKWYMRAAEMGDAHAMNQVALKYVSERDYDKAFYWYKELANQNNAKGFCGMAKCYENRITILNHNNRKQNTKEIQTLYQEAEKLYNLAIQNVNNIHDEESAYWGLGGLYHSWSYTIQQNNIKTNMLKKAIYYYMVSYDCGNDYGLKNAKDIAVRNKIVVNFNDIDGWARKERLIE